MLTSKRRLLMLFIVLLFSIGTGSSFQLAAQPEADCDVAALLEHQQEHAAKIADLEHAIHEDLNKALENLYITGVAYQVLAVECGFNRIAESVATHAAEHATGSTHADDDGHASAEILEAAQAVGDPDNGAALFNTLQPEVGFACATCHRVDTTERLIGPGLLGVGSADHDPSEHETEATGAEGGHAGHGSTTEADHDMDTTEAVTVDPVEYIRTSILEPSAFLVPDFPDNLMPKTYGEIFTEDEINDLIAYLLTLQ